MNKEELQDGWEDCISVLKREFNDRLDLEIKSQQQWGHEAILSIESFRKIVNELLNL